MWQIIELRRNHPILQIMTAVLGHRRRSYRIFCPDCHLIKYFDVPASDSSSGGHWHLLTFPSSSVQQKSGWPPD
ncbi:hypothetical protein quinque_015996 [Culex quinquefasciatus]